MVTFLKGMEPQSLETAYNPTTMVFYYTAIDANWLLLWHLLLWRLLCTRVISEKAGKDLRPAISGELL